jgi:zinc transporter ZupT
MAAAVLVTVLALVGVIAGSVLGQSRTLSNDLAAAGGGLLAGICVFWLSPEIAGTLGWPAAIGVIIVSAVGLVVLDRFLVHTRQSPRHGVVAPLMIATAVHSFLDGWSVSALAIRPLANIAVPIGLALHKIPEGLALGWINRKVLQSVRKAMLLSAAVEFVTILGAWLEPRADRSGEAAFGPSWTAVVLAIVGGSFLFLGLHTVLSERKRPGIVLLFVAGFVVAGLFAWARSHG